ncbi:MAG TPA: hypothetical protein DDY16_05290 [Tenacibaculum sp.]|nr:hypothetical protein [Tenacibaculum sp.]
MLFNSLITLFVKKFIVSLIIFKNVDTLSIILDDTLKGKNKIQIIIDTTNILITLIIFIIFIGLVTTAGIEPA